MGTQIGGMNAGGQGIKASTDTGRLLSVSKRQKHSVLLTRLHKSAGQQNRVLESMATNWLPDEFYYASQGMRDLNFLRALLRSYTANIQTAFTESHFFVHFG